MVSETGSWVAVVALGEASGQQMKIENVRGAESVVADFEVDQIAGVLQEECVEGHAVDDLGVVWVAEGNIAV
jgi:hypothetical protein